MAKLRLAIVRQKYCPDGGAERFISRIMWSLNDYQQIDLNIITRNWENNLNPIWNIHICNPLNLGRYSRERGFAKAARKYWENKKFDLVQSHERISGCDIFRAGDGVHRMWLKQRSRISSSWIWKKWKNLHISLSPYHKYVLKAEEDIFRTPLLKAVICNSEMVKNDIIQCFPYFNSNKIHVIYNAIDSHQFQPATELLRYTSRKQLNLPQNATVIIYVGSGFERKGLKTAITAIANSDRFLVIVGHDKNLSSYQKFASSLNCLNKLRFVGIQENVQPFYHAADALLLPTFYDPCPNVILEAMACGLAVITSNKCGGAELICAGQEGFVCDPLDIKGFNEAILSVPKIATNSTMSNNARRKIEHLTPQYLAEQLNLLYQKLV